MFYVKHTYDDGIKEDDKQPMLLGLLITNHYLYSGNPYYIYDKATGEWSKKILPHLIDELPIYHRSAASYIELAPDFEGWIMVPATSFRDNKNTLLSTFTDVKLSPGTLGGVYGGLTYGDLCLIENIDPSLNGDTGTISSNAIALASDFPFEVKEKTTTHSITPLVPNQVRNYPLSPSWNMQTMTANGNRYSLDFKLPDPFARNDIYPEATYKAQYDKLFSADGKSYIGGILTNINYYSYDDGTKALQTQNARLDLAFPSTFSISNKAIMFYVKHTYDSDIADADKQEIEFAPLVEWKRPSPGAACYRYDINKKQWTAVTPVSAGSTYAPNWSGGSRLTIPVDFEGWYLIPAASFNAAVPDTNAVRFYWHALGGKYGNLTIGDVCITDITNPLNLGDGDRATSTNTTNLAKDFPLAAQKPILLGPQK